MTLNFDIQEKRQESGKGLGLGTIFLLLFFNISVRSGIPFN